MESNFINFSYIDWFGRWTQVMCAQVTLPFKLFSHEITAVPLGVDSFLKSNRVILMLVSDIRRIIRKYMVYAMGRVEFN